MTAGEALKHPWLAQNTEEPRMLPAIQTDWHRLLYHNCYKELRDDATCALGRCLALVKKNPNDCHSSKVETKSATYDELGPHLLPMYHLCCRESESAKLLCKVSPQSSSGKEVYTW